MPLPGEGLRCAGTSKRSGEQCKNWAMQGKKVCQIHGGKTPSGRAHPSFKHGRYSKVLPRRLLSRYAEALADAERLVQREEIALVESLLKEQLERKKQGGSVSASAAREIRRRIKRCVALKAAIRTLRPSELERLPALFDELQAELDAIGKVASQAASDASANENISRLVGQKTRIVESERRRMIENKQMMMMDEVLTLFSAAGDVFAEAIKTLPEEYQEKVIGPVDTGLARLINARAPVRPLQYSKN